MTGRASKLAWIRDHMKQIFSSIAFYPALIALGFLGLSYLMIHIDFSEAGKQLKAQMEWLKLKDASTARTVISVIAAGILSLTVFSFTMVMVILNQAASQMSNRVIDKLIGNRYQQLVLGFYIGTIVYALFLLSSIRDIDSGIYVPSLSTYLLIALAIVDIFLFIYFLHYITQSIKYAVIIRRIRNQTMGSLKKSCRLSAEPQPVQDLPGSMLASPASGIFSGFDKKHLLELATSNNLVITLLRPMGRFILERSPIAAISPIEMLQDKTLMEQIQHCLQITEGTTIEDDFYFGFRQLTEVAVKALSPGINDPGTAVDSLHALTILLAHRLDHFPDSSIKDKEGETRIITREYSFEEIFQMTLLPIWSYGKNDLFIQQEMLDLLTQLQQQKVQPCISKLLNVVREQIAQRSNTKF